jgi:two-component system, LytTR family, sensor kinase
MRYFPRIRFVLVGWALASIFFTAVLLVGNIGDPKPPTFALYANAVHFALWTLFLPLLTRCTDLLPLYGPHRTRNIATLLLIAASLAGPVMVVQWLILFFTYFPYHSTGDTFWLFLKPNISRFYPSDVLIGIVIVVAIEGLRIWQSLQASQTRGAELERQLVMAHLHALRMQLHPHFLFNTLHTIASLIAEQPVAARRMVIALGELLRFTLKDDGHLVCSLAEELKFADLYLSIEKLRMEDRLFIHYDIGPETGRAEVPQLLLQPLFENAVRHGAARMSGLCEIRFKVDRDGEWLRMMVSNDGPVQTRASTNLRSGVGLTNIKDRLRLHYADSFTFRYEERPQGGVQIDFSIPYKKTEKKADKSAPVATPENWGIVDLGEAPGEPVVHQVRQIEGNRGVQG